MLCRDGTGKRCTAEATQELVDPDGKVQGHMCLEHAWACVIEYRQKLGERWSVVDTERATLIADRDDTAERLGECQSTIATMTTALEQALQALTVTANESASGTRTAAAVRAKAKRYIRVALGKSAFEGITR